MTIIYDNVLNEQQLNLVEQEINFLMPLLEVSHIDGSAKKKKKGTGYLLPEENAKSLVPNIHALGSTYNDGHKMSVLLNVYDDNGYYKRHTDDTEKTLIFFLKRNEDIFTGGELVVEDDVIEYENNIAVEFKGEQEHEVLPVSIQSGKRLSLTYFYYK